MINSKVEQALNEQVHAELYSFYLYLSIASYFKALHLDGFSHWMRVQAQEELGHGVKLMNFVEERGGRARLLALDAPPAEWPSGRDAVADVLAHERGITGRINDLVDLAESARDHATKVFLHWFVSEQVEEEANAEDLLHRVEVLKESPGGLLMLDRQLAARPAAKPAAAME